MKEILYLGYYDTDSNKEENRYYVLAASNKMTYISMVLKKLGYRVNIVSASGTLNKRFYMGSSREVQDGIRIQLLPTTPHGGKMFNFVQIVCNKLFLLYHLLKKCNKDSILIVYHSCSYMNILRIVKKMKKCTILLEMEEIYGVATCNKFQESRERRFASTADGYLFPTDLLAKTLNVNKPYVIIHGTYYVEEKMENVFGDGKIHVVYAGTFDSHKGGAIAAIEAAEYLPESYHIHIIGFGCQEDTNRVRNRVKSINDISKCKVSYDGLKSGKEYLKFIQSCDIGLSTQNPSGLFNNTSFPSKILSYMANGLRVVCVRIPVVEASSIGKYMYYYEQQTPSEIAQAIMKVDVSDDYDGRKIIEENDNDFTEQLEVLIRRYENDTIS